MTRGANYKGSDFLHSVGWSVYMKYFKQKLRVSFRENVCFVLGNNTDESLFIKAT